MRTCLPYSEYDPKLHIIISGHDTLEECMLFCKDCKQNSSSSSGADGGSSSSSVDCYYFPVTMPYCTTVGDDPICTYLGETYENGCPKSYYCGCLDSNGVCGQCPSSSSSSSNYILDNLETFKEYSLDQDLIDLHFNEGVNFNLVDLDSTDSSSSSSGLSMLSEGPFLLTVNLSKREFWDGRELPADFDWYIYGEEIGGMPSPGLVVVERKDARTLEISLSPGNVPDGATEFSFKISVEYGVLAPSRTKFVFRKNEPYSRNVAVFNWASGRRGRLSEEYKQYLHGWLTDYWAAKESGDESLVQPLVQPYQNSFLPFDPFAHARWKLLGELQSLSTQPVGGTVSGGNAGIVTGNNFLGVDGKIFDCIMYGTDPGEEDNLYNFPMQNGYNPGFLPYLPNGAVNPRYPTGYRNPDVTFDCRSFALLGADFLRAQLADVCPNAVVRVAGIGAHFLVHVDLEGNGPSNGTCCKGSFLYEPQNGTTYKSLRELLDSDPDLFSIPPIDGRDILRIYEPGQENADNDFGEPNWASDPKEVSRVAGRICGCLTGSYASGTNEAHLQGMCNNGEIEDWVKNDMGINDGKSPANLNIPVQKVECKHCVIIWEAEWECGDKKWTLGMFPGTECMTEKEMEKVQFGVWDDAPESYNSECKKILREKTSTACGHDTSDCGGATLNAKQPALPGTGAPKDCCGAWCVKELACDGKYYQDGTCDEGTFSTWSVLEELAGEFQKGKSCKEITCNKESSPPCNCVYQWTAKYNCDSKEWEYIGGNNAVSYCGESKRVNNQWVVDDQGDSPLSDCYRVYEFVGPKDCDVEGDCEQVGSTSRPPLPLNTLVPNCCGAWCTGEKGCDENFYVDGCESGTLESWQHAYDQEKAQAFQAGKTCSEITCTVQTLPKCGAWCTGEFGCDGKFYVRGCDSGTLDEWTVGNSQDKVQNFQEGKTCDDITDHDGCKVQELPCCKCDCIVKWVAYYSCDNGWELEHSEECGEAPTQGLNQWVVEEITDSFTKEYFCARAEYISVNGKCDSYGVCQDLILPPSPPPVPEPSCCGAWCKGDYACDGTFYVDGCTVGTHTAWEIQSVLNKAQAFQAGKTCSDITCTVQTPPNCGAWCTGEFGCDGLFYVSGCETGLLSKYEASDPKTVEAFREGKTCLDLSCTARPLPKCGAWCTGEKGCDGKFYVAGCAEGTFLDWEIGDLQNKAQAFQEGKTCSDITCDVQTLPKCNYYLQQCQYNDLTSDQNGNLSCGAVWACLDGPLAGGFPTQEECIEANIDSYPDIRTECPAPICESDGDCGPNEYCDNGCCKEKTDKCVYEWMAKYDCNTGWDFLNNGKTYSYCGQPLRAENQWVIDDVGDTPLGACYRIYTVVADDCTIDSDCSDDVALPTPALPTETPECCGAWCTGEFGCDGKFYILGCDSGTLAEWQTANDQNKVQNFQAGKTCSDITCTVETLPKCGAWCTGEFGCDGKFHILGCDSGTLDEWTVGNSQDKVQNFQEGKTCATLTCLVDPLPLCKCVYTYSSDFDCSTRTWSAPELVNPTADIESDPQNIGSWEVSGGSATIRVDAGFYEDTSCPSPTPPSTTPDVVPEDYCSCVFTYKSDFDCSTQTWSAPELVNPSADIERDPQNLDEWDVNGGSATYRVDAGFFNGAMTPGGVAGGCPSPTPPSTTPDVVPEDYCSCVFTYKSDFDCSTQTWSAPELVNPSADIERDPQNLDEWDVNGGSATYRVDAGFFGGVMTPGGVAGGCPSPTPPSTTPDVMPQDYCKCFYTYSSDFDCSTQTWSVPVQQGNASIEPSTP